MKLTNFDFDAAIKVAQTRAEQMVENGLYSRFGLNRTKRIENALLGCMGEVAFEHLLQQKGIEYKLDETDFTQRNSDEFDFLIGGNKIDVKVAKKSTANPPNDKWTYGYPEEQRPATKDYVVVGWIDFVNKEVGFYGWLSGQQIAQYPVVTENTFAGYQYLTPNHEFRWGAMEKDLGQMFDACTNED